MTAAPTSIRGLVLWFISTVTYFQQSGRLEVECARGTAVTRRWFKRAPERPLHPTLLAALSFISTFILLGFQCSNPSRYLSASMAAMQPEPAAEIAWR